MSFVTFQDWNSPVTIRASAILGTSYVAGTILGFPITNAPNTGQPNNDTINVALQNQLMLYVNPTLGSLTSAGIKIEFSPNDNTYYQEAGATISGGTETDVPIVHTFTSSTPIRIPVQIKDRYIKISSIGTGTVTGSLMSIDASLGVA